MIKYLIIFLFFIITHFPVFSQSDKSVSPIGFIDNSVNSIDTIVNKVEREYGRANIASDSIKTLTNDMEKLKLPPLRTFLESVYDHPSTRIFEAKRDAQKAETKITKEDWLNYFRGSI